VNSINEFSPIVAVRPYMGKKAEPVTAHLAHVLVTTKGEHRIVWPHDRAHSVVWQHTRTSSLFRGQIKTVYDIDLGIHHLRFDAELPGAGDTFSFKASAVVEWRVLDPSLVVRSQLSDIRPAVQPAVIEEMRRIAREFGVEQSAAAERAINERLVGEALDFNNLAQLGDALAKTASSGHVGREYGVWTRTIASVQPDRLKQELRMLQEQNKNQVLANRMGFYRDAFMSGDIERAVLQVAQNPEELSAVAQMVREQELAGQRMTIDFVNKLLEAGAIERWQVNDQAKAALDWLRQSTNAVLTPQLDAQPADAAGQPRKRVRKTPIPELESGPAPDSTTTTSDGATRDT
jgi:hypothetical protein